MEIFIELPEGEGGTSEVELVVQSFGLSFVVPFDSIVTGCCSNFLPGRHGAFPDSGNVMNIYVPDLGGDYSGHPIVVSSYSSSFNKRFEMCILLLIAIVRIE